LRRQRPGAWRRWSRRCRQGRACHRRMSPEARALHTLCACRLHVHWGPLPRRSRLSHSLGRQCVAPTSPCAAPDASHNSSSFQAPHKTTLLNSIPVRPRPAGASAAARGRSFPAAARSPPPRSTRSRRSATCRPACPSCTSGWPLSTT
jgi:hypothetical protein